MDSEVICNPKKKELRNNIGLRDASASKKPGKPKNVWVETKEVCAYISEAAEENFDAAVFPKESIKASSFPFREKRFGNKSEIP